MNNLLHFDRRVKPARAFLLELAEDAERQAAACEEAGLPERATVYRDAAREWRRQAGDR